MDLNEAQELLRSPRSLTREQWLAAYKAIQDHNHQRLGQTLSRGAVADDVSVSPTYGYDGAYFVEANTGPGGPR